MMNYVTSWGVHLVYAENFGALIHTPRNFSIFAVQEHCSPGSPPCLQADEEMKAILGAESPKKLKEILKRNGFSFRIINKEVLAVASEIEGDRCAEWPTVDRLIKGCRVRRPVTRDLAGTPGPDHAGHLERL